MSPWNIISIFKPKRESENSGVAPTVESPASSVEPVAPDEAQQAVASEPISSTSEPNSERMVVRVVAQEPPTPPAFAEAAEEVDVPSNSGTKALAKAESDSGSKDAAKATNHKPVYDLGATRKAGQKSRIKVSSTKHNPTSKPANTAKRDDYVNKVFGLDDEIRELRLALAEKLEAQNSQLREMLSRFGEH